MTSNALFFKLFKKDFSRRISSFTFSCIISFFLFPVLTGLILNSSAFFYGAENGADAAEMLHLFTSQASIKNAFYTQFYVLFSALIAMMGFSFLHKPKQSDFYHGLPIKRSTLFFAVFWSGLFIILIPHALSMIMAALIATIHTGSLTPFKIAGYSVVLRSGYIFFCYSLAVFALSLSGKNSIAVVSIFCSYFYLAFLYLVQVGYRSLFYQTYVEAQQKDFEHVLSMTSPYIMVSFVSDENALPRFFLALLYGLLFLVAGVFLYKKRKNEAAGKTMAYPLLKVPVKFLICFLTAMFGGLFFYSMTSNIAWGIFGLLSALIIVHCSMEILYHSDFKKLFANLHHLSIGIFLTVGVFLFYAFDLGGYDRWFPAEAKLESAAIIGDAIEENNYMLNTDQSFEEAAKEGYYYGYHDYYKKWEQLLQQVQVKNYSLLKKIVECHQNVARNSLFFEEAIPVPMEEDLSTKETTIWIRYHLKNGREIDRKYYVNFAVIYPYIEELYNSKEYKEDIYPLLHDEAQNLTTIHYIGVEGQSVSRSSSTDLEKVLLAYKMDLLELTYRERFDTRPIGSIRFLNRNNEHNLNLYVRESGEINNPPEYQLTEVGYYPIYSSFYRTIEALMEIGIDAYKTFNVNDIVSMELWSSQTITYFENLSEKETLEDFSSIIIDKEDQKKFLQIAHPMGLPYESNFDYVNFDRNDLYHLTVELKNGRNISLEIYRNRIDDDLIRKYNIR